MNSSDHSEVDRRFLQAMRVDRFDTLMGRVVDALKTVLVA